MRMLDWTVLRKRQICDHKVDLSIFTSAPNQNCDTYLQKQNPSPKQSRSKSSSNKSINFTDHPCSRTCLQYGSCLIHTGGPRYLGGVAVGVWACGAAGGSLAAFSARRDRVGSLGLVRWGRPGSRNYRGNLNRFLGPWEEHLPKPSGRRLNCARNYVRNFFWTFSELYAEHFLNYFWTFGRSKVQK